LRDAHQAASGEGKRHVVGVFVARPGGGAFLDRDTARMHLSLFNMPFQVALLMDGVENYLALYRRAPGQPFVNTPFFLVGAAEEGEESEKGEEPAVADERTEEREVDEPVDDQNEQTMEQMSYDD
jgi:hypothetical protein